MMRRHATTHARVTTVDPVAQSLARAKRARRRSDVRGEVNALRQACLIQEFDAALWTRLADALVRASKLEDALQALRHALWLRVRAHDEPRACVTRRLIDCVQRGIPLRAAA